MKDRHKYVVDTFKGVGTGLIVAGAIGLIFNNQTLKGVIVIFLGWSLLLIGFLYLVIKEGDNE